MSSAGFLAVAAVFVVACISTGARLGACVVRSLATGRVAAIHVGGPRPKRWSGFARRAAAIVAQRWTRRQRTIVDAGEVATLLDSTARRCAGGESLGRSLCEVVATSSLAGLLAPTVTAVARGDAIGDALAAQPTSDPHIALAVHVLRLCAAQGGNISESLDRAATTLRERHGVAQERLAQSAQALLSARVLTLLPVGFGLWTAVTNNAVQQFLVTPVGIICISTGLVLNVAGWTTMNRTIRDTP